jgi:hypothetical protein
MNNVVNSPSFITTIAQMEYQQTTFINVMPISHVILQIKQAQIIYNTAKSTEY